MVMPRNINGSVSFVGRALRMWLAAHIIPHKVFANDCGKSLHTVRDWVYGRSIPSPANCAIIIDVISHIEMFDAASKEENLDKLLLMARVDSHYRHSQPGDPLDDMALFKKTAYIA